MYMYTHKRLQKLNLTLLKRINFTKQTRVKLISTPFSILIEFGATEYYYSIRYSIRIQNFDDIRFDIRFELNSRFVLSLLSPACEVFRRHGRPPDFPVQPTYLPFSNARHSLFSSSNERKLLSFV